MLAVLLGACLFASVPAKAQTTIWSAMLTVAEPATGELGCNTTAPSLSGRCSPPTGSATTALTDYEFSYSSTTYKIARLYVATSSGTLVFGVREGTSISGLNTLILQVGTKEFPIAAGSGRITSWRSSGLSWTVGDMVSVSLVEPPPPTVSLSVSPNPVWEGSSVTVTAQLSRALSGNVTIPVTLTDNSAESTDYGTLSSIAITAGSTSGTDTISTNHDTDEDDETFTVSLGTLPPEVTAGTQSSVQITIRDDEGIPTVSLSADPNPVPEGENVTVTATLSEALSGNIEIPLLPAWNTGTVETGDIKGPPGTITVHSGNTTGETIVLAVRDCDTENEEFIVELNTDTLPASLRAGTQSSVTITITDDGDGEWCDSRPPSNTGGTTTGGGGGFGGGGGESPSQDEEPSTSCPREDREILRSFYKMTDGNNWHENGNWNSEEPLGEWHGVETDEDGNVVSLRLEDNNLSGEMPTRELLCLKELVELALWGNDDLMGEVLEDLVLAVERAALRYLAETLNINPEWFEDYEDPFDFEDWHEGVTTDDDRRVTELDFTGEGVIEEEIPENIFELLPRLGEIMITRSSGDGGCTLSPEGSSAFGLFLLTLVVFAALVRKRARG